MIQLVVQAADGDIQLIEHRQSRTCGVRAGLRQQKKAGTCRRRGGRSPC